MQAHGASLYYEQHGEGDHHVLLLHGWGCSTELFAPVTKHLAQRAHVTAVDFAGHGQSSRPPVPWGAEDYVQSIAEMIEALGIAGCDVIGHSHGGRTALLLAAEHPALVGKVIAVAASGLRAEATPEQKKRSAAFKRLRGIADTAEKVGIFGGLPEKAREALRQKYGSADYKALDAEMRQTFVKVVNFDLAPSLPKIKAPTLLVWGTMDTETPLWMGEKMESLIPDAGLVRLEGGTHYAYLEKAPEFLRIADYFLFGGTT